MFVADLSSSLSETLANRYPGLIQQGASLDPSGAGEKIEAMFLSVLLKSLRETGMGDGLFPGDKSDTMGALFDQHMSDHLASSGGIGIGAAFASGLNAPSAP